MDVSSVSIDLKLIGFEGRPNTKLGFIRTSSLRSVYLSVSSIHSSQSWNVYSISFSFPNKTNRKNWIRKVWQQLMDSKWFPHKKLFLNIQELSWKKWLKIELRKSGFIKFIVEFITKIFFILSVLTNTFKTWFIHWNSSSINYQGCAASKQVSRRGK